MNGLSTLFGLLKKEWREHRGLIIGLVLAAPALSLVVKALNGFSAQAAGGYLALGVPATLAVFFVAVAADLVAADSAAGRHGFTAALPVRPATIWAAKVVFLFGTALAFLVWMVLFEALFFAPAFYGPYSKYTWIIAGAPVLGAVTFFWSTLIDRGFTAAFGALFTVAIMAVVGLVLTDRKFGLGDSLPVAVPRAAPVVALAFLAGSLFAFAFGRIHLGGRWRRIAIALATLLIVLVPASMATWIRLERWVDLQPGDPELLTRDFPVDPAGEWDFVVAFRAGTGPLGAPGGNDGPHALLAVNRVDGRIRDLTAFGTPNRGVRAGEQPGHVRLLRHDPLPDSSALIPLLTDYDLEAGEPVFTRPLRKDDCGDCGGSGR